MKLNIRMHGSEEGLMPKHEKTKNVCCRGVKPVIRMTSDFSDISLCLSGTVDCQRDC